VAKAFGFIFDKILILMKSVVIVDYGMGNHFSVFKRLKKLGANVSVSENRDVILNADSLILPGVGHFGTAMHRIAESGLKETLNQAVLEMKKPILGICLGMQLMTMSSEEGNTHGLGWIDASVHKFSITNHLEYKIPHTGWNTCNINGFSSLFKELKNDVPFYFLHSYYVKCNDVNNITASTSYDLSFVSAFQKENIFGVQFHPEKSHDSGLHLLKNFISL
jgi:glutamine amidotransferase